ncbi:MAG: N-acetylglucosamine-6-phosphate deacetylase [Chloroflexota bacterium]
MPAQALLTGACVLLPNGTLERADVLIESGHITGVETHIEAPAGAEIVDLSGLTLAPGFIDVHVHGGGGFSLLSAKSEDVSRYAGWLPSRGVTGFLATICSANIEDGIACATAVTEAIRRDTTGARILGVNFEGPFVSPDRRGALPPAWLAKPDAYTLDRLLDSADVRVMTIAPELDGATAVTERALKRNVRVSVGHSDAEYAVAKRAFDAGASHVTHAFNAMRPLHHREPGPIGAAIDSKDVTVEVIADGVHLHPAVVHMLIEALGPNRVCLITDAVTPAGLASGTFRIGREEATLQDGSIRLPDGTIAGSAATMDAVVRNTIDWGCANLASALRMASEVSARVAGVSDRAGRIATGYDADLVALTENLEVSRTWVGGRIVYSSDA